MICVRCSRCQNVHERGIRCPFCVKKYNTEKRDTARAKFYRTKAWRLMRQKVLDYYCNVDIWMLGLTGKLIPCSRPLVHHIKTYEKHPELALSFNNLICLSSASHNIVHEYYDTGRRQKAVDIIKEGIRRYEEIKNGRINTTGEAFTD